MNPPCGCGSVLTHGTTCRLTKMARAQEAEEKLHALQQACHALITALQVYTARDPAGLVLLSYKPSAGAGNVSACAHCGRFFRDHMRDREDTGWCAARDGSHDAARGAVIDAGNRVTHLLAGTSPTLAWGMCPKCAAQIPKHELPPPLPDGTTIEWHCHVCGAEWTTNVSVPVTARRQQ